eukprot:9701533-Alexandrium_andersonii.AAC.1
MRTASSLFAGGVSRLLRSRKRWPGPVPGVGRRTATSSCSAAGGATGAGTHKSRRLLGPRLLGG